VDGGRFAVKRLVGDTLALEVTAFKDGHDLVAGRFLVRGPGDRAFRALPADYDINFDRLSAAVALDRVGPWSVTAEAWTDRFGTWRSDMLKRIGAGQDVAGELEEGARLVDEAAEAAPAPANEALRRFAARVRDPKLPVAKRAETAVAEELFKLMRVTLPPADAVRHGFEQPVWVDRERAGFAAWYEMFPRSQTDRADRPGTFATAARALPRLAELGFDVVYLPPIHPIGQTKRKGRNNSLTAGPGDPGSPWAIGSADGGHDAVEPALGTLEDFDRFVQAARDLNLEIALDFALQCSPDHPWLTEHPDWFFVRPDGSIRHAENPPKKYEDIVPLNFWCDDREALWNACRDLLLFWIGHGVTTFRVDNPHTKPFAFWEWALAEVRRDHPEVVFLSEAFTRPARMKGLAKLGFTQSYTYFTWRNSSFELRDYLTELTATETVEFLRGNFFANTPDILHEYLQQGGRPAFQVRLLLAGTLSPLYGIYAGYELCENVPVRPGSEEPLDSEKYEIRPRDVDAPGNLNGDLRTLNALRRAHPALQRARNVRFLETQNAQLLGYHRWAAGDDLLFVVNLDPHAAQEGLLHVPLDALGIADGAQYVVEDLLAGTRYTWRGSANYVRLDPARAVAHCLRVVREAPA